MIVIENQQQSKFSITVKISNNDIQGTIHVKLKIPMVVTTNDVVEVKK